MGILADGLWGVLRFVLCLWPLSLCQYVRLFSRRVGASVRAHYAGRSPSYCVFRQLGSLQPGTACLVAPSTLCSATPSRLGRASICTSANGPQCRESEFHLCGPGCPVCGAHTTPLPQDVSGRKRPSPQRL